MHRFERVLQVAARRSAARGIDVRALCCVIAKQNAQTRELEAAVRARFPKSLVVTVTPTSGLLSDPSDLARHGRFDVLIDMARGRRFRRRLKQVVPLVRAGGIVVAARPDEPDGFDDVDRGVPQSIKPIVGHVETRAKLLILSVHHNSVVKLLEPRADEFLRIAGPVRGRTLTTVPGLEWEAKGSVGGNDDRINALPRTFTSSPLSLREYNKVSCHLQSALIQQNVALPEAFRRQYQGRTTNHQLADLGPDAALAPEPPDQSLSGTYFHLDNEWRGQFGHNLLEQISRTWGWTAACEAYPEVRALLSQRGHTQVAMWELELLEAAGIDRSRVQIVDAPVVVERLLTASPAYAIPDRIHPQLAETYDKVGYNLGQKSSNSTRTKRVFFSRRTSRRRACQNASEVEATFHEAGFSIIYPEDIPLFDQVQLIRGADLIGGFAGSGIYHIGLTGGPKKIIVIGSSSYTAVVEPTLAALLGHELYVVTCDPVDDSGFNADFRFDFNRDGKYLQRLLGTAP